MIRWESNFSIPDSTVQLAIALVVVDSFRSIGDKTVVSIRVTDESGDILAKAYDQELDGVYQDLDSMYQAIKPWFNPSEII